MKKIIYVMIALTAIFSSCKKDDNTSASPKMKVTRADLYQENGFISGTIVGKSSSGVPFEKSFSHQLDSQMATYKHLGGFADRYFITLNKLDKFGRVGEDDKKTDVNIVVLKNKSLAILNTFYTSVYIDSSATSITKFKINSDAVGMTSKTLSNVVFETSTGKFDCDYSITVDGSRTSSGYEATITGKISTALITIQYRTGSSL